MVAQLLRGQPDPDGEVGDEHEPAQRHLRCVHDSARDRRRGQPQHLGREKREVGDGEDDHRRRGAIFPSTEPVPAQRAGDHDRSVAALGGTARQANARTGIAAALGRLTKPVR